MTDPTPPYALSPNRRVLILAYCGHRRYVVASAPMDAWQRGIEKCKPCPECAS